MRSLDNFHLFMAENDFRPEYLASLLEQGIEMERIKLQIKEIYELDSHESQMSVLQGERLLQFFRFTGLLKLSIVVFTVLINSLNDSL